MSTKEKTRVVVAMSGGVDSSVAAALLKDQGYDVIGVSLKLWDYDEEERVLTGKTCCSLDDIADARDVCAHLGIPFYAFNHKQEFHKKVIDKFVADYTRGFTPNPCILCNQFIKFGLLLKEAKNLGATYLATGHHARIERDALGLCHLKKGLDPMKDQSYVLFHLMPDELAQILFPIGDFSKAQVRDLAKQFGLVTHDKRESQDICFIPDNNLSRFIAKNYPEKKQAPGNFVDRGGHILGQHAGIDTYTIGQRRGLGVAAKKRLFVTEIRPKAHEIVLGSGQELTCEGAVAHGFRFIHGMEKSCYGAKLRYQRDAVPVEIVDFSHEKGRIALKFMVAARAVTPGQAVVLYDDDEVVGGGWITESIKEWTSLALGSSHQRENVV